MCHEPEFLCSAILAHSYLALTLTKMLLRDEAAASSCGQTAISGGADNKAEAGGACGADHVMAESHSADKKGEKTAESQWAINRANLLRYLTELVKFYPGCAHLVVRSTVTEAWSTYHGHAFLSFAMRELLPVENGASNNSLAMELSRRATALLLALFSRSCEARKRLMTEIINIFMEDKKQGSMTQHLKVIQSLADVLMSVLTTKASVTGQGAPQPVPEIIKLMHESKIVNAICCALDSIDLHHPIAHKVSSSLLRPLDFLCGSVQTHGRGQPLRSNAAGTGNRAEDRAHEDIGSMDVAEGAEHEGNMGGQGSHEGEHDNLLDAHHHDVETSLMMDLEHHGDGGDGRRNMLPADEDSVEMHEVSDGDDDDDSDDSRDSDEEEESHGDEDDGEDHESDMHDAEDEEDDDDGADDDDEDDDDGREVRMTAHHMFLFIFLSVCQPVMY